MLHSTVRIIKYILNLKNKHPGTIMVLDCDKDMKYNAVLMSVNV